MARPSAKTIGGTLGAGAGAGAGAGMAVGARLSSAPQINTAQ